MRNGVSACTIDEVSECAGVTRQLVHKYFGTRTALLQELFQREDDRFQAELCGHLDGATTFEHTVRVFVTANFDQLSSSSVMGRLRSVPEVATIQDERRRSDERSAERVLVKAMTAEYPASPGIVEFVLRLGSAASIEAGNLSARRGGRNRETEIDNAVRFILAGIRELTGN